MRQIKNYNGPLLQEYLQKIKDYYNHITRICDDEENGGGAAKRTKVGGAIA